MARSLENSPASRLISIRHPCEIAGLRRVTTALEPKAESSTQNFSQQGKPRIFERMDVTGPLSRGDHKGHGGPRENRRDSGGLGTASLAPVDRRRDPVLVQAHRVMNDLLGPGAPPDLLDVDRLVLEDLVVEEEALD